MDRAVSGPYALWNHEHCFVPHNGGTTMRDRVTYALPLGWIGEIAHTLAVKRDVEKIFDFRARECGNYFRPEVGCTKAPSYTKSESDR